LAQAAAGTGGGHRVPPWGAMSGIASLPEKLANLDEAARADVARVLRIKALEGGEYEVPEPFRSKVARWCGGASDAGAAASDAWTKVLGQRVISVHGIWTYETSNFNPLRTLRPVAGPMASTAGPDAVASACAGPGKCDFCDAERLTVVEPFGRVQGRHSLTAGNVFKSAGVHGLVIWSRHEPHLLTQEEVTDGFRTADEWFDRAAGLEIPEGGGDCYPMMFWNCFRNAGASQVHPHMQLQLFPEPVALGAMLREQGARYIREAKGGRDLCRDVARAHQHLGLAMDVETPCCSAQRRLQTSAIARGSLMSRRPWVRRFVRSDVAGRRATRCWVAWCRQTPARRGSSAARIAGRWTRRWSTPRPGSSWASRVLVQTLTRCTKLCKPRYGKATPLRRSRWKPWQRASARSRPDVMHRPTHPVPLRRYRL